MTHLLRSVEVDDLAGLEALDGAYAARHGLAPVVGAASLAFYARSGHAFVATDGGAAVGFALAQAVWDGARPTVRLVRLAAAAPAAGPALAEAVVKSAYDAAVYDLVADVPASDVALADLLAAAGWGERPVRRFERVLGSRAARSAA
jgi:hypothetical protein